MTRSDFQSRIFSCTAKTSRYQRILRSRPTNGDMTLNPPSTQPAHFAPVAVAAVVAPVQDKHSVLQVMPDPGGADVELDGNFVGNTPSQVDVPPAITCSV
jgi:hypothetical protein